VHQFLQPVLKFVHPRTARRFVAVATVLLSAHGSAAEQPGLKLALARYETTTRFASIVRLTPPAFTPPAFTPVQPDLTVPVRHPADLQSQPVVSSKAEPENPSLAEHLEKSELPGRLRLSWISSDNDQAPFKQGKIQVGYGPVYYDSSFNRTLVFFESKGTRTEEPTCGYVKISFRF